MLNHIGIEMDHNIYKHSLILNTYEYYESCRKQYLHRNRKETKAERSHLKINLKNFN